MGEISDALARAKQARDGGKGTPSRPLQPPDDRRAAVEDSNDEPERTTTEPRSVPEVATLQGPSTATAVDKSGLDARIRAEILSKPTASIASPPAAAPAAPITHSIPRDRDETWIQRLCVVEPDAPVAVRFRHFGARVRAILDRSTRRSVLVTSAFAGEGKTTVSTNLTLAIASIAPDARVALVDLDLRRGTIGRVMGYQTAHGIEAVLKGKLQLDEIRVSTDLNGLDFYPLGEAVSEAHEVLGRGVARLLEELHNRYDYVVCDGPPVLPVPDVPLIAPHVGGCLAVVGSGKTRHKNFSALTELVPGNSLFGVFLNECPAASTGHERYQYYGKRSTVEADGE